MEENTRTQRKHSIVKLKKVLHLITALAFFLQQLVPYSSTFAMSDGEGDNVQEGGFVRSSTPVPNLSTPSLIETPPLRIIRPAQETPPEVAAPLSASLVAVQPQAVEESGISFSGFTPFRLWMKD